MLIGKVPKQESHAEESIPPPVPPRVSSLFQKPSHSANNASTNLKPQETPLPSQCSSSQGPQPPPIPPKQQPPPIPPKQQPPPIPPRRQSLSAINAPPLPSQIRKISAPLLPLPQGRQANALSLPPKLHQPSLTTQSPPIPKPRQSQVSSSKSQLNSTATALQEKEEKKDPSSLKPVEGSMSLEYITMKKMLADLVDLLAGNAPVISQLNNHLFSSDLIPKAVHVTVETTGLTPYDRSNKIFSSVRATLEYHPNPNSVFSSLITSLQKVGLNNMAFKLMENFSECSYSK